MTWILVVHQLLPSPRDGHLVLRSLVLLYGVVVSSVDSSDILYSVFLHHLPSLPSMLLLVSGSMFYQYPDVLHWVHYEHGGASEVSC